MTMEEQTVSVTTVSLSAKYNLEMSYVRRRRHLFNTKAKVVHSCRVVDEKKFIGDAEVNRL